MMEYVIGICIACIAGIFINRISKYYVESEKERRANYSLSRAYIIATMVIVTIVAISKFNFQDSFIYILLSIILFIIAIIDYYTYFVYTKTIVIGSITIASVIALFGGTFNIKSAIIIGIYLIVLAFFTGKWYGDVQVVVLITLVIGYAGILVVLLTAALIGVIILALKRGKIKEITFCPMLYIGYLFFLIIC